MDLIAQFWQDYQTNHPDETTPQEHYVAEQFGDNAQLADALVDLIARGIKTATCSALWEWEA
ncbi:MAG: ASCH domain-containing protein, partial [Anaerolineae bacterium]|nr:ASCH domain-containing protein [Anaerolineae bacterium]